MFLNFIVDLVVNALPLFSDGLSLIPTAAHLFPF